jgi:hypothetical protein
MKIYLSHPDILRDSSVDPFEGLSISSYEFTMPTQEQVEAVTCSFLKVEEEAKHFVQVFSQLLPHSGTLYELLETGYAQLCEYLIDLDYNVSAGLPPFFGSPVTIALDVSEERTLLLPAEQFFKMKKLLFALEESLCIAELGNYLLSDSYLEPEAIIVGCRTSFAHLRNHLDNVYDAFFQLSSDKGEVLLSKKDVRVFLGLLEPVKAAISLLQNANFEIVYEPRDVSFLAIRSLVGKVHSSVDETQQTLEWLNFFISNTVDSIAAAVEATSKIDGGNNFSSEGLRQIEDAINYSLKQIVSLSNYGFQDHVIADTSLLPLDTLVSLHSTLCVLSSQLLTENQPYEETTLLQIKDCQRSLAEHIKALKTETNEMMNFLSARLDEGPEGCEWGGVIEAVHIFDDLRKTN